MLESVSLSRDKSDSLVWIFNPNKRFSVNSFCLHVEKLCSSPDHRFMDVAVTWKGLVPPRAEFTVWFVHIQRLNTRKRLY